MIGVKLMARMNLDTVINAEEFEQWLVEVNNE